MKLLAAALLFTLPTMVVADDELPRTEQAFLEKIQYVSLETIVEQLGEPGRIVPVANKDTGEFIGSAWLYHYINTDENSGEYYKMTEIDLIDGRVVGVIFSNIDFEDDAPESQVATAAGSEVF